MLESLCTEESKQRKEIEEALAKEKEEYEKVKIQLNKVMEDLRVALDKKSSLESQIAESDGMVEELELSIASVVQLLQTCKKERDEFLVERDKAIEAKCRVSLWFSSTTLTFSFLLELMIKNI